MGGFMKALRSLLLFLVQLVLALAAINFIFADTARFPRGPILQLVMDHFVSESALTSTVVGAPVWRLFWIAVFLLLALYWVVGYLVWRHRPRAIQVQTSSGESLLIHPGAILKFVRLQVASHPAVASHKVKIRQKGNRGLSIWTWVNVRPIDSLPAIKRQLEDSIREGFSQVMGIEKIDDVTIIIGLDEKSLNNRPGPAVAPEPKPEPPLRSRMEEPAPAGTEPHDEFKPTALNWETEEPGEKAAAGEKFQPLEPSHPEEQEKS